MLGMLTAWIVWIIFRWLFEFLLKVDEFFFSHLLHPFCRSQILFTYQYPPQLHKRQPDVTRGEAGLDKSRNATVIFSVAGQLSK